MKKIVLIVILLISASSTYGQQVLWSTTENHDKKEVKYVPYQDVTNQVLELYDLFKFYYDFTGFNKENFHKYFNGDNDDWNWIKEIEDNTVIALRSHIEGGSAIVVLSIDKSNINMIVFSNVDDSSSNMTFHGRFEDDRKRFEKWFKTLLN